VDQHAFLYENGQMADLGTLNGTYSVATGINDAGVIVGYIGGYATGGPNHGFVYANGTMYDLNSLIPANSGWEIAEAQAINSNGEIVGTGLFDGQQVAYLLTPTPEPSSLVLLGIGAVALLARSIRKRAS
jgi:probable HAF family extracellular repeat protein